MNLVSRTCTAILCASLVVFSVSPGVAQTSTQANAAAPASVDVAKRMEALEEQVQALQSQLAALKQSETSSQHTVSEGAPVAGQSNLTATAAEGKAPAPVTLSSLLGSTTLSGFIDGFYGYAFNAPVSRLNTLRTFDVQANQFSLNLMELVIDKPPEATSRSGFHIALAFGQAINEVNATEPGNLQLEQQQYDQYLKEAYYSYLTPVGKGLQLDFGKFVTPLGYEVIESKDNWNYTRGLLFSFAIPFYHYGVRAKYAFNDKYSVAAYATNGWNNVVENNTRQTYGGTFAWTPNKKLSFTQNYLVGPEEFNNNHNIRQISDTVATYNWTPKFSLAVNYDYARGDRIPTNPNVVWYTGVAGYAHYAFTGNTAATVRYEYYDDHYGFTTGTAQNLNEVTGTFEHLMGGSHVISRLEYRRDMSNQNVFAKGIGQFVFAQTTLDTALIFTFDTKGPPK